MAGSDPAGGRACENTHAPTPLPGRPRAGSLPFPVGAARAALTALLAEA